MYFCTPAVLHYLQGVPISSFMDRARGPTRCVRCITFTMCEKDDFFHFLCVLQRLFHLLSATNIVSFTVCVKDNNRVFLSQQAGNCLGVRVLMWIVHLPDRPVCL